jgi:hypothetical protein
MKFIEMHGMKGLIGEVYDMMSQEWMEPETKSASS